MKGIIGIDLLGHTLEVYSAQEDGQHHSVVVQHPSCHSVVHSLRQTDTQYTLYGTDTTMV